MVPDKPRNLTVAYITSKSAVISWLDLKSANHKKESRRGLLRFLINLKKGKVLIWSITMGKVNEYKLNNLTSYTTYEISVSAGNHYGFGEESVISLLTSEEGEWEIRVSLKHRFLKTENLL